MGCTSIVVLILQLSCAIDYFFLIMERPLIESCKYYFKVFSDKNIEELSKLFADDIVLSDWDNFSSGKSNVLLTNKKIFDSVKTINVKPKNIYQDGKVVIAELDILINKKDRILVVDIIHFNEFGKICRIKAFKG